MKKKAIAVICSVAALIISTVCIVISPMIQVHKAEKPAKLLWDVKDHNENPEQHIELSFRCMNERRRIISHSSLFHYDGTVLLTISTRGIPLFFPYADESYDISLSPGEFGFDDSERTIRKIVLISDDDELVLWEEEVIVDRLTAQMFAIATNDKVTLDGRIDALLTCFGVDGWAPQQKDADGSYPSGFGSRLTETDAGYKLEVAINGDVVLYEKPDALKELQKYSCILIALIDDLDEVTWNYSFNGKTETLRFETSDAVAMLGPENGGRQIKEYGRTAGGLQKVMNAIDFLPSVFIG